MGTDMGRMQLCDEEDVINDMIDEGDVLTDTSASVDSYACSVEHDCGSSRNGFDFVDVKRASSSH